MPLPTEAQPDLTAMIVRLRQGESLSRSEASLAIAELLTGTVTDEQITEFLVRLADRGESPDEIAGAADALRQCMTVVEVDDPAALVDTCGTGGSGLSTFNVSTAAAIVAAATGIRVVKHGNRAASGSTGSADVLEQLGVTLDAPADRLATILREVGLVFLFAPRFHQAMKRVAAIRKALARPTIFNLLGPLANPARAGRQIIGAGRGGTQRKLAQAVATLGTVRTVVVRGADGLGEVSLGGSTSVIEVTGDRLSEFAWTPDTFGLPRIDLASVQVAGPAESATMIRSVLAGEITPARYLTVANAAAAIWLAGRTERLDEAARMAEAAIDQGLAAATLDSLCLATASPSKH